MCRRKTFQTGLPVMAAEGAYEGQTMRLDERAANAERRGDWCRAFPWWALWLIWPLIGLAKWIMPLYASAATAVFAQLSAAGAEPFIAVALIVVGLVLIRRG